MKELVVLEQDALDIESIPFANHVVAVVKNNRTRTEGIHVLVGKGFNLRDFSDEGNKLKNQHIKFNGSLFGDDVLVKEILQYQELEDLVHEGVTEGEGEEDVFGQKSLKVKFSALLVGKVQ